MKTFKLSLEPDQEIPRFKRLKFQIVDVPLADVLTKGIHPWQPPYDRDRLWESFIKILNSQDFKAKELEQFSYCEDIREPYASHYHNDSAFEETLKRVQESIYFIDSLSYTELLEIAKENLRKTWSHRIAYRLLDSASSGFDEMRSFVKKKDRHIKISGYADFDSYDLGQILKLEDFEAEDAMLISEGIPLGNFRSSQVMEKITDDRGLLKLKESIDDFRISAKDRDSSDDEWLTYNCTRRGDVVRFILELEPAKRAMAQQIASRWRDDNGRYCFSAHISKLNEMVEQEGFGISFPTLHYEKPREQKISSATVVESTVQLFCAGFYLTCWASNHEIRAVLRNHGVSMTGRKEELLDKLAHLAARIYEEKEHELDEYFSTNRFIRVDDGCQGRYETFPVLQGLDAREMVLTMYIIKHLRGNVILEARHNNDTFDLLSLARALVKKEVSPDGFFMGWNDLAEDGNLASLSIRRQVGKHAKPLWLYENPRYH